MTPGGWVGMEAGRWDLLKLISSVDQKRVDRTSLLELKWSEGVVRFKADWTQGKDGLPVAYGGCRRE